jgi:hypothetical protein
VDVLTSGGLLVAGLGLFLNAYATMRTMSSRKLLNYQELIKSHRDLWKLTLDSPKTYERLFQSNPDLEKEPISDAERRFVNLLLLHMTTAFAFSKRNDIVRIEQFRDDVDDVLAFPIPRLLWLQTRHYFNRDFVKFVDGSQRRLVPRSPPKRRTVYANRWTILVLSVHRKLIVDTLSCFGDRLIFLNDHDPIPTSRFIRDNKIDFVVCFGYGRILPREVTTSVPVINVHPSYLPLDRGPNPHLWTILNNSPRGATIHYIDEGIDTGDIIAQRLLPTPSESTTFAQSFDQLITDCAVLLADTWPSIRSGANTRRPQEGRVTKHSFADQTPLHSLWNEDDLSLPIDAFRCKALPLLETPARPVQAREPNDEKQDLEPGSE